MNPEQRPPTRSFKPRRRRLGPLSAARYAAAEGRWLIDETGPLLDVAALFERTAPLVLDIGFGAGEGLLAAARSEPERDVLGVEIHRPGLARVVAAIEAEGLTNIRLVEGDVLGLLRRIPAGALAEVRVYFPDPWPKHRQQRRRLVNAEVVDGLIDRLGAGGRLRLATDWADYARQIEQVCGSSGRLAGGRIERPADRPTTRFEQRGIDAGREIVDFDYTT